MISGGVLYTKWAKGYILVCYPVAKTAKEYNVADGTVRIEFGAATGNKNLEKLIFPVTLEHISDYAFNKCDNLKEVVFKSYYAPVIEGSAYGSAPSISSSNKKDYPAFDILYKYSYEYLVQGTVLYPVYYNNFKGAVGHKDSAGITAVYPKTGEGYDSLIYRALFTASEDNSGENSGKYAVAFMEAVFNLPAADVIDRFDRLLMEAAINAYNALQGHTEELKFVGSSYIEKFNAARVVYNVDVVESLIAHLFDIDATEYSFEKVKEANAAYLALTDAEKALVTGSEKLQTKIKDLSAALGRDVDFSLSYEDHLPKEPEGPIGPDEPEPKPFPTVLVIVCAAVLVVAAAGVVTLLLIRKKKSAK